MPRARHEIQKGNAVAICLRFAHKDAQLRAHETLKRDGQTDGLHEYPWSPP